MSFNVEGVTLITEGVEHIVTEQGPAGFVLVGPYEEYDAGRYFVTFKVLPSDNDRDLPDDLVAVVDVAAAEGREILATGNVFKRRAIERNGSITLPFELDRRKSLEFRVQSTGRTGLTIQSERRAEKDPHGKSRYCPVLLLGDEPDAFVDRFFEHIRYVQERGFHLKLESDGASIEVEDIDVRIDTAEDFQVFDEIFVKNDYRYDLHQNHIVIDVGMNVGFASLFFARNVLTKEVHSFEPFGQPYTRALVNISRNPVLSDKIIPHHFGLSDHDENISVNTVEGFTLGMTLKGLDRGTPEAIRVRTASQIIRPLIENATARGYAVVLKLDCEGSEFPIFDSLIADHLLDRIDIIMIEWHKEWSPDHSQQNLIDPLRVRGFAIFDHTISSSQIAGMIYAVRRSSDLHGKAVLSMP